MGAQLLQAFSNYGFFKIINHGITEEKTKALFEWVCAISCSSSYLGGEIVTKLTSTDRTGVSLRFP